jgi:zinc protease
MRHLAIIFILGLIAVVAGGQPAFATVVQEVTSPKGVKAWLVEEHALPLVAVKMGFVGGGSAYDSSGKEGLSAMAAAMLMEGAGDLDSKAFNAALENKAISLTFAIDEDMFRVSLESLSENKDQAFSYLGMALTSPRFDDSALERVRRQTLSVLTEQEKNPQYLLHRQWEQIAFPSHPYGHPSMGTKDSVEKINKSDLGEFTRRYLTRENILIAVVGDITPSELGRLLDAHLGTLPEHYDPAVKVEEVKLPTEAKQVVVASDIPQTLVIFGTNGIKREDPGYYAAYVMNQILGGGSSLSSILGEEIREKRGLAYAIGSQATPMLHSAIWHGMFSTRNEKVGSALAVLRDTLKGFSKNGPTDQQVADAKTFLTGSFVLGLDSNADIASYLISMQQYHLGRDYLEKRNKLIEAVSKEDIKTMARQLADPSHLLVVMVGKPNLETSPR